MKKAYRLLPIDVEETDMNYGILPLLLELYAAVNATKKVQRVTDPPRLRVSDEVPQGRDK